MKKLIGIFSLICLTYTAFGSVAVGSTNPEKTANLPTASSTATNSTTGGEDLKQQEPTPKTSAQTTLFNFAPFSFMKVDSVPTISTFGGTDRFRKAITTDTGRSGL